MFWSLSTSQSEHLGIKCVKNLQRSTVGLTSTTPHTEHSCTWSFSSEAGVNGISRDCGHGRVLNVKKHLLLFCSHWLYILFLCCRGYSSRDHYQLLVPALFSNSRRRSACNTCARPHLLNVPKTLHPSRSVFAGARGDVMSPTPAIVAIIDRPCLMYN